MLISALHTFQRNLLCISSRLPAASIGGQRKWIALIASHTPSPTQEVGRKIFEKHNPTHLVKGMDKKQLTFEEFKQRKIEPYEEFKNSPSMQLLCKDDPEKTRKIYEGYCRSRYAAYQQGQYGGHPGHMV